MSEDGFFDDVPSEALAEPAGQPTRPIEQRPNAVALLVIASLFPLAVLGFPVAAFLLVSTVAPQALGPATDPSTLDLSGTAGTLTLENPQRTMELGEASLVRHGDRYVLRAAVEGEQALYLICETPAGLDELIDAPTPLLPFDWHGDEPPSLAPLSLAMTLVLEEGVMTVKGRLGDMVDLSVTARGGRFSTLKYEETRTMLRTAAATGARAPRAPTSGFELTVKARYAE